MHDATVSEQWFSKDRNQHFLHCATHIFNESLSIRMPAEPTAVLRKNDESSFRSVSCCVSCDTLFAFLLHQVTLVQQKIRNFKKENTFSYFFWIFLMIFFRYVFSRDWLKVLSLLIPFAITWYRSVPLFWRRLSGKTVPPFILVQVSFHFGTPHSSFWYTVNVNPGRSLFAKGYVLD